MVAVIRAVLTAALLGTGILTLGCRTPAARASSPPRPALVVMITVDQLRADQLERFDPAFTGGFRRLRDRGIRYSQAWVDHAVTVSHPGHATLATGLVPARHGIVDAAFFAGAPGERRLVDALADPAERILGVEDQNGVSPRNFLADTLIEWIRRSAPESRAVALGSGQYSSLLHAGRARGDVYWYSAQAGRYVTSSYYRSDYPEWVDRFNRDALPRFLAEARAWDNRVPEEARILARPDAIPFEADGVHTTFPHLLPDHLPPDRRDDPATLEKVQPRWLAGTPVLDAATLALARESVRALSLGRGPGPDCLNLVLSQVDDIGHWYGPFSQEQLDNLVRLDRELGELFSFLDAEVGEGRYLVALSADHGAPEIPELASREGVAAWRVRAPEIERAVAEAKRAAGSGEGGESAVAERVAAALERIDFIADVMTPSELAATGETPDPYLDLYRKSYRADRVPRFPLFSLEHEGEGAGKFGVTVRLKEGAMIDLDPVVHGSPYDYDRRVPLIFMGPGIPPGVSGEEARTVDVAPTLAARLGIPIPPGLDGRPLLGPVR